VLRTPSPPLLGDDLSSLVCSSRLRYWLPTPSWISAHLYRRMSKDYERLCATGEAFVYAAISRLMV
jgi:hypothetical protein